MIAYVLSYAKPAARGEYAMPRMGCRCLSDAVPPLANSDVRENRVLARQIVEFLNDMPLLRRAAVPQRDVQHARETRGRNVTSQEVHATVEGIRNEPKIER